MYTQKEDEPITISVCLCTGITEVSRKIWNDII
jgi:hypothetical protein